MSTSSFLATPVTVATQYAQSTFQLQGDMLAAWAPGRVNLIGEHTDYNDGYVLPVAIKQVVAFVGQMGTDPMDTQVHLYSVHHNEQASFDIRHLPDASDTQQVSLWARYISGVLAVLQESGVTLRGFSAVIAGDVPLGGGMSSSAALLIASLTWLDAAFALHKTALELAHLGQQSETRGSGVRVGILDHAASVLGKPGQAVLIDCRSLATTYVPFQLANVELLICETGVERSLATSKYNERRAECEEAVRALASAMHNEGQVQTPHALRDITEQDLLRLGGHIDQPARQRARHVITENQRTLDAVEALHNDDAQRFGDLILRSHASLRDDYAVSCPELDAVVEIATAVPGALGARLVGAGFGGGALIVAESAAIPAIEAALYEQYPARSHRQPTIYRVAAAGGPGTAIVSIP